MKYRNLVKNEEVSLLGFGCMRFPTIDGEIDKIKSSEMLTYAIENGVNYLDTAYAYHEGESEVFVGKYLEENNLRDKVKLATKLPSWLIQTKDDMYKYLYEQLEKLRTDHIDFYLVHTLTKEYWQTLTNNGLFEFLDEIKEKQLVKHIGFSFHDDLEVFKEIVDSYDWEFTQIQYNYLDEDYQAGTKGLEYAHKKGLGVIIMEPLRGGKLVNQISGDLIEIINNNKVDKSPLELAFQYIYDKKEVSLVLSGMSQLEHVISNCDIVDRVGEIDSLTSIEKDTISKLCECIKNRTVVGCTDCKYCMPCPLNVDIPRCFRLVNDDQMFFKSMKNEYSRLVDSNSDASRCVECGKCEQSCPQHINIISKLKLVTQILG